MLFHREPQAWGQRPSTKAKRTRPLTSTHLKPKRRGRLCGLGPGAASCPASSASPTAWIVSAPLGSFPLWPPFPEALPPTYVCLPGGSCVSATALLAPSHRLRDREPPCPASRACGTCSHNVPIKDSSNFFDVCSSRLPSHMIDGLSSDIIFA